MLPKIPSFCAFRRSTLENILKCYSESANP